MLVDRLQDNSYTSLLDQPKIMPTTLYPPLPESAGGVLPPELKAKFKQIRDISHAQRQLQEKEGKENDGKLVDDGETVASDLEQRKLRIAVETAVACENEISRLAKGVAELEELLARQEGEAIDPVAISFPSLPSFIPNDDDEAEMISNSTTGSS